MEKKSKISKALGIYIICSIVPTITNIFRVSSLMKYEKFLETGALVYNNLLITLYYPIIDKFLASTFLAIILLEVAILMGKYVSNLVGNIIGEVILIPSLIISADLLKEFYISFSKVNDIIDTRSLSTEEIKAFLAYVYEIADIGMYITIALFPMLLFIANSVVLTHKLKHRATARTKKLENEGLSVK